MVQATGAPIPYDRVPGPRGLPWIGNALQIDRDRMHQQLEAWAHEYGGTFALRIASRRMLVVTNPETIATVLRDRPGGFQRTDRLERISREFGFPGLFSVNGDTWRRQRPMVLSGLDPSHIRTFFPTLVQVTERLARRWRRAAAAGAAIDLQADLMRYTVDVTTALALGEDMNTLESPQEQAIQLHLNHILPALFRRVMAPFDHWKLFPGKADRELAPHLDALRAAVQDLIAKARRTLQEQPALREQPANLIQAMVAVRDRGDAGLTDEDVAGNVLTMLLAGEDTTANTLAWMIWLLHRNPQAAETARQEIRAVLGGATCPGSLEQLARLEWTEACAHEAMRLKPVAPLIIGQACHDTVVEGIRVAAGTIVLCLMRPAATDARHFPDPQSFLPGRWLQGAAGGPSAGSAKRVAMPFGAGPRMCPGRYLALAEIKMVAAMLHATFEIDEVAAAGGGEPRELIALTMSPVGLRMRLRNRQAMAA